MALAIVYSRANCGLDAPLITVEVHLSSGLPSFNMVGLAETAVKEAKDRVRSAILNSGFDFPKSRITVNLAPADLPKSGSRLDVAIAVGILQASGQLTVKLSDELGKPIEYYGELALTGDIRPIKGVLPALLQSKQQASVSFIAQDNQDEASLLSHPECFVASNLLHLAAQLTCEQPPIACQGKPVQEPDLAVLDLIDVKGQFQAKRALEIAAAGKHNLIMFGPPGTGKTMLANRIIGILPPLGNQQALEVASLYSISNHTRTAFRTRPFRNPHHTCSGIALVGGGAIPQPGEISLAHHGVLFLDELPEFGRQTLDVLREPLENGEITISRAAMQTSFPSRFQLICALNPSPNGDAKDYRFTSAEQIRQYLGKLSGPFLDRIDLQVEVPQVNAKDFQQQNGEPSHVIRRRVYQAWQLQFKRQGKPNCELSPSELETVANINAEVLAYLQDVLEQLKLSARSYHRILKVARSIADLAGQAQVEKAHLIEALQFRQLDQLIKQL